MTVDRSPDSERRTAQPERCECCEERIPGKPVISFDGDAFCERCARDLMGARITELHEALRMAVYHAVNLKRVRNGEVVRDLDESQAGFVKAVALLEELDG